MERESKHGAVPNCPISHGLAIGLLAVTAACGGSPTAGPSPLAPPLPAGTVAAPQRFPPGLDPAYVRTVAAVGPDGRAKRWDGGPFRHCIAPEVDRATIEPIIAEMSALSGIPRTEAGPCNVTWNADYERRAHSYTELAGNDAVIVSARVFLCQGGAATARHEAGHVLGLAGRIDPSTGGVIHSPRGEDLMNASPRVDAFSRDELAVLAWIYGR